MAQPPPWGPPAPEWPTARSARPPSRWPATVVITLVSVVLLIAGAAVGRPDDGRSTSAAMNFVPPSGTRVVLQGSDGNDEVDEYFVTRGLPAATSGPAAMGLAATDFDQFQTTSWLRLSVLIADRSGRTVERQTQLYAALPSGLELRVAASPNRFLVFQSGVLMLPSNVRDGQAWSVAGTVAVGAGSTVESQQPFTAGLRASAAPGGCFTVDLDLSIGGGSSPSRSTNSSTWCPGQGVVAAKDDTRTLTRVTRAPIWQQAGRVAVSNPRPDPTSSGALTGRDMTGASPMALGPRVAPVVLPGPVLVYPANLNDDLIARGWDDGKVDARWSVHPGGKITTLSSLGRIVLATTSQRRIVAYGSFGEFLWQQELPDTAEAQPVRMGDLIVVASVDGSISAFRPETGELVWLHRTPNEIRQPLVVSDTGVVAVDQAGNLLSIAPDGTRLGGFDTEPPESFTVGGGVAVVSSRNDSIVRAYRLDGGAIVWRTRVIGAKETARSIGSLAIFRQSDLLVALRLADGATAWTLPIRSTALARLGETLLASDRTHLHRIGASGTITASWPTGVADLDTGVTAIDVSTADTFLFNADVAARWEPR